MYTYRTATKDDIRRIAQLHALSWQQNYRGILSDTYLDREVRSDRLKVWNKRLLNPNEDQHIVLAFDADIFCGFACTFAGQDPQWGAMMDNLHVFGDWKGKGIGAELMRKSAKWVYDKDPGSNFYLTVLKDNLGAIRFYKRMGGEIEETTNYELPGGTWAAVHLVVWKDLATLAQM